MYRFDRDSEELRPNCVLLTLPPAPVILALVRQSACTQQEAKGTCSGLSREVSQSRGGIHAYMLLLFLI